MRPWFGRNNVPAEASSAQRKNGATEASARESFVLAFFCVVTAMLVMGVLRLYGGVIDTEILGDLRHVAFLTVGRVLTRLQERSASLCATTVHIRQAS